MSDNMRYNLVTKFVCAQCGTQLALTYDVPKNVATGYHPGKNDDITGAAKVENRIAIHPCTKCYGEAKEPMTDKQIHIHQPAGYYIGQVGKAGHKLWQTVTEEYRNPEAALIQLAPKMKDMKRGRVLFIDDSGYYEPNVVMEVNRT